ncbi:MAG: bifunctional oligoribonuclease/PAP phosphatase NrnA [Chloroflexi bacterium]|nr:MAG: bifunctional oligoribonuclease/PAP phosphatase NrnA [Chloroflexota bacterium]
MSVATRGWPSLEEVAGEIRSIVSDGSAVGCMAHKDADADSLGSALGFALSLREMGKRAHVIVPEPLPLLLSYLPGFDTLETGQPAVDTLFTFDCATLERFGEARPYVEGANRVVSIDHHASNTGFGTINLVDPDASATGQVVFRLLREIGAPITPAVANNLYAALFTDTGGFRHENTTEGALRLGAELVALGADPAFVALRSYKWRSIPRVRLEGLAIAGLQAECGGRLVWSQITQAMLEEAGADMQESEGVIDTLQSIDTMKIAILFKESEPASTKISVRSRDPYNATDVCTPFGGGGHQRAAGAELHEPLLSARPKVLDVARRMIESSAPRS